MKRLITFIVSLVLFVTTGIAQVIRFNTTSYTSKVKKSYGWTNWRPRESSDMLLTIDLDSDLVTIYSPKIQVYKIIDYLGNWIDQDGDQVVKFEFIDQDGDRGMMRLIERRNGNKEIYIDFSNIIWVYSVIRLQ